MISCNHFIAHFSAAAVHNCSQILFSCNPFVACPVDYVWILLCWLDFFLPTDFECLCWLLWVSLLIGFEFLCLIDAWSTTFIVMISYVGCIFFWICISWRLVEVSFKHDDCTKSILWFWKFITLSWGSVHLTNPTNFDFHNSHLFAIRKVRRIINYLMLRAYYFTKWRADFHT